MSMPPQHCPSHDKHGDKNQEKDQPERRRINWHQPREDGGQIQICKRKVKVGKVKVVELAMEKEEVEEGEEGAEKGQV